MSDIVKFSSKELDRAKRVALEFRDVVAPYLKDAAVEVKDWDFSVGGSSQKGADINVAIKLELKPKHPLKHESEQKPAMPSNQAEETSPI